jgi:hypothetical protein
MDNQAFTPYQIVMTNLFVKRGDGEMRFGHKRTIQSKKVLRGIGFSIVGILVTLPISIISHSFTVVLLAVGVSLLVMIITDNYSPMEGESFFAWLKFFLLSQLRERTSESVVQNLYIDLVPIKTVETGEWELISQSVEVGDNVEILLWR